MSKYFSMNTTSNKKLALVTGSAGFIGFHISKYLLEKDWQVIGLDSISDYYDVSLKQNREKILLRYFDYYSIHKKMEERNVLKNIFEEHRPQIVIHLAAQAGVRHSIENPRAYLESNIVGTFELLEAARSFPPKHLLIASSSSTYGANEKMPYKENDDSDHPVSFYAATKKSTESIAHSYSHLYKIPITMFRFFTVYGPWGRPDMALFKFTKAILNDEEIDIFNFGNSSRDFTYIDDLVKSVMLLIEVCPRTKSLHRTSNFEKNLTNSLAAPFRIVNIGNSKAEKVTDLILQLEKSLNKKARKNFLPMQSGDLQSTWADTTLLENLIGYKPNTNISVGVSKFVQWYLSYFKA